MKYEYRYEQSEVAIRNTERSEVYYMLRRCENMEKPLFYNGKIGVDLGETVSK